MSDQTRTAPPRWIRFFTTVGRPFVLVVALIMCAPGEYHLAKNAGWSDPFAYGMPIVLSVYAGLSASVASTRYPGDRGRASAIIGAGLALSLAIAAQIVSHLIDTGHIGPHQPWLIAATSLVPPAVVGHVLHLAASLPSGQSLGLPEKTKTPVSPDLAAVPQPPAALPAAGQPKDTNGTGETPPEDEQHAEDAVPEEPRLLTSSDVAERYGVDKSTVRGWVAAGRLTVAQKDARGRNWFAEDALPLEVSR